MSLSMDRKSLKQVAEGLIMSKIRYGLAVQCGPESGLHGFLNFCIYKKFEFEAFFGLI